MNKRFYTTLVSMCISCVVFAQQTYCPGNHGMIDVGMTTDQVLSACGAPSSRQQSDAPVTQKVPMTQMIYTTLNQGAIYQGLTPVYTMYSLPSGSQGVNLQINLVNNKVVSINMNGSNVNSSTLCSGGTVQMGDSVSTVYDACGSPAMTNNTYIKQPIIGKSKPEIWFYQANQYAPVMRLTFLDGILQSIE